MPDHRGAVPGGGLGFRAKPPDEATEPLTIEAIDQEGPKEGEVLVEAKASGIRHTDAFTLSGADPGSRRLADSRGPLVIEFRCPTGLCGKCRIKDVG